jgi:hypothetical protein
MKPQGVCAEFLIIQEFATRIKIRRDRDSKKVQSKDESQTHLVEINLRRKDAKLFGEKSLRP